MVKLIFTTLPMFVCGFWAILTACSICVEKRNKSRLFLLLFMATATMLYVGHFIYLNRCYSLMPLFDSMYSFANLAVYPLFYLYIIAMTSPQKCQWKKWWVLLPALLIGLSVSALYILMSNEETHQFVEIISYNEHFSNGTGLCYVMGCIRIVAKIIFTIEVVWVLIAGTKEIKQYNKFIESYYADTEGKDLDMFQWFMYLFTACSLVSVIFNILGRSSFENTTYFIIPSLMFSTLLFGLGFVGLRQSFSIESFQEDLADKDCVGAEKPDSKQKISLAQRIEEIVTEQNLYLQNNLKVSDIATRLNTNRLYVSAAINNEMHISFSDYINKKRVEHAVRLIRENPQMTMYEIAERSGFSSDKSFYRNFRNITGKSPKHIMDISDN